MGEHAEQRLLVAALSLALAGPAAASDCRMALSLGLDVSSSVDSREYALQVEGMAAALRDPAVREAFLAVPGTTVALHVFEWSGRGQQSVRVDWTPIAGAADLEAAAARMEAGERRFSRYPTAVGDAMLFGAEALAARGDCAERVLDLSGDGEANDGIAPEDAKRSPLFEGITVNGLVIGVARRLLERHYSEVVIHGPGAFVEEAVDHADFGRAMRRKLVRELQPKAVAGR